MPVEAASSDDFAVLTRSVTCWMWVSPMASTRVWASLMGSETLLRVFTSVWSVSTSMPPSTTSDFIVTPSRLLAAGTSALALTSSSTPSSSRAAATSEP